MQCVVSTVKDMVFWGGGGGGGDTCLGGMGGMKVYVTVVGGDMTVYVTVVGVEGGGMENDSVCILYISPLKSCY